MWADIKDKDTGELHYRGPIALLQSAPGDRWYVGYDALTCQYLPIDRYDVCVMATAPTVGMSSTPTAIPPTDGTPGARCKRCGDLGADADLGGLCLECDYDTEGDYDVPTDHAGTPVVARARVELLDTGDRGTVVHTGNVVDDGTVRVSLDGARGTVGAAPNRLNVIDPHGDTDTGTTGDTTTHTGSRAIPAPGALDTGATRRELQTTYGRELHAIRDGLATAGSDIRARLERSDIGRA